MIPLLLLETLYTILLYIMAMKFNSTTNLSCKMTLRLICSCIILMCAYKLAAKYSVHVINSTHCCHNVECIVQTPNADTSKNRFSSTLLHYTSTNIVSWQRSSVFGNHWVTSASYVLLRPEKCT